jgi:hypothetical protein
MHERLYQAMAQTLGAVSAGASRERFDALRAKYLAARAALSDHDSSMRVKYGSRAETSWLSVGERKKLEALRAKVGKVGDAFVAYVASISPRDWSYGVPVSWLYEDLSFDDAVRPLSEKLSVKPPLSYGATEHRT